MVEILAYHGWGYDASFWQPLKQKFPKECTFKTADRGYFGDELEPKFTTGQPKVILAHSYGLHWIKPNILKEAQALILTGSFDSFLPPDKSQHNFMIQMLNAMSKKLEHTPFVLMDDFWKRAFDPMPNNYERAILDTDRLETDLNKLHHTQIEHKPEQLQRLIIIEAEKDLIVSGSRKDDLEKAFGIKSSYGLIEGAGHAFPYTHSEETWSIIKASIPIFS